MDIVYFIVLVIFLVIIGAEGAVESDHPSLREEENYEDFTEYDKN